MSYLRFRVTEDGQILGRKLPDNEVIGVLTNIKGHKAQIEANTPPLWLPPVRAVLEEGERLERDLTSEEEAETVELTLPPELVGLAPIEDLFRVGKVNNLVDVRARALEQVTEVFAHSARDTENHHAGRRLYGRWFDKGLHFLQLSSRLQWGEVHLRFDNPSEQVKKDVDRLNLTPEHEEIIALNRWMGRLLGIDPNNPNPPEPPPARDLNTEATAYFVRLIGLANAVWHTNSEADVAARQLLVGAYLSTLSNT